MSLRSKLAGVLTAVALCALAAVAEEVTSGPAKGPAAMLHFKPLNVDTNDYCVTCKAGTDPNVVAFVTKADDDTKKLLKTLDAQLKAGKDKSLHAAVVIVEGEGAKALASFVADEKLAVPAGVVDATKNKLFPKWKINDKASNTVVYLKEHAVDHSVANTSAGDLEKGIKDLLG